MRRWYEVWKERVAATERLRMCIAAKRISFRLFKQIYWQSFDEDIQVRPMDALKEACPTGYNQAILEGNTESWCTRLERS